MCNIQGNDLGKEIPCNRPLRKRLEGASHVGSVITSAYQRLMQFNCKDKFFNGRIAREPRDLHSGHASFLSVFVPSICKCKVLVYYLSRENRAECRNTFLRATRNL